MLAIVTFLTVGNVKFVVRIQTELLEERSDGFVYSVNL